LKTLGAESVTKPGRRLPRGTLNYFAEVARCGSVRQAADRLYVAGSAVSRQIAKLERFVGTPLFERRAGGMYLTEAGTLLSGYLNRTDRELDRALSAIDDLRGLKSGEVSISTVEGMIDDFLPGVIETFRRRFPGISFSVRIESALSVVEAVAGDLTDIGIGFNVPKRRNLVVIARHAQPILAVCAPGHALAKRRKVTLAQLNEHPLALLDTSFGTRRLIDDAFARARLPQPAFLVTNSILMLKSLARKGGVATLLPSFSVQNQIQQGQLVSIPTNSAILNSAHLDLCVHNAKRLSSAAAEFLDGVKRELGRLK
jgi:DNA-binding transcriptional LysR family regulator